MKLITVKKNIPGVKKRLKKHLYTSPFGNFTFKIKKFDRHVDNQFLIDFGPHGDDNMRRLLDFNRDLKSMETEGLLKVSNW